MNPNLNKRFTIKRKQYTQSQINRCEITIKVMNSRGEHETEHKTMKIQTYIHAFIIRKLHNYYTLFLSHLRSCVLKLVSVLHEVISVGNRVPKGRTCEGEAGFKQVYSGFGQYHRSRWGTTVVANKKVFEILGCQISKSFED